MGSLFTMHTHNFKPGKSMSDTQINSLLSCYRTSFVEKFNVSNIKCDARMFGKITKMEDKINPKNVLTVKYWHKLKFV